MRLIDADKLKEKMISFGFKAPDMTATEFVEDEIAEPPIMQSNSICDYCGDEAYKINNCYRCECYDKFVGKRVIKEGL